MRLCALRCLGDYSKGVDSPWFSVSGLDMRFEGCCSAERVSRKKGHHVTDTLVT